MANKQLFANNAISTLRTDINDVATQITLQAGDGVKFPVLPPGGTDFFPITLENPGNGVIEICTCTSRTTDFLTVVRAQEGTSAVGFPQGSNVEARVTARTLDNFAQKSAGESNPGVPPPPSTGAWHMVDGDWAPDPDPGPAKTLPQSTVDGLNAAVSMTGGNRAATMADVAAAGPGALPTNVTQALLAANNPQTANPFATIADMPTGGGGGTVLSPPIVDALNSTGQSPSGANPFAVRNQLPALGDTIPGSPAPITMGQLRGLKDGSYGLSSVAITHPILGTVQNMDPNHRLGPGLPFAVSGTLTKTGRSTLLALLQVDRETDSYVSTGWLLKDDGAAADTDTLGGSNPKTHFVNSTQLTANDITYFGEVLAAMQARLDQLQLAPEDVPGSAGDLRLSLLYEPFCVIEGFASGANVFDGTARLVQVAWKTSPDPAVASPKELFTLNAGIYGHLLDGMIAERPFITIERVLGWIAAGTKIVIQHLSTDSNIANLLVTPFSANLGGASAQALTRSATKGLVNVAASVAASGAFFADGAATPTGRLSYKDPSAGNAIKRVLFEGDVVSGDGSSVADPPAVTADPLQFVLAHAGAIVDLDLAGVTTTLNVNFDDDVACPAGRALTGWFFTRNVVAGKSVQFNIGPTGTLPGVPGVMSAYMASTGTVSFGLASSPSSTATTGKVTPQQFTIPAGTDINVLFVAFFNVRNAGSNIPAPINISGGLMIGSNSAGVGGAAQPWDHIYTPDTASGMAPVIATMVYSPADQAGAFTQYYFPILTDVGGASPNFSNIHSVQIYAFIMSSTQLQATLGTVNPQFFAGALSYAGSIDNTIRNSRTIYIIARRGVGANPGVPLTVAGATAISSQTMTGILRTGGTGFTSGDMIFQISHEASIVGNNAVTWSNTAQTGPASVFSFQLAPIDNPNLIILGPSNFTGNNLLIPYTYNPAKGFVRICG